MATAYLDASDIASLDFSHESSVVGDFDYPTPAPSSEADAGSVKEEPVKKKRKAWGQPVPEIVQILPPRKRAKTAEEKEQRKNERILRNRRAADKSRQRQKAQQANLEQQNKDLIAENAQLKELLAKAGLLSEFTFVPPPADEQDQNTCDETPLSPSTIKEEHPTQTQQEPTLSQPTPPPSLHSHSPSLAPQLDLEPHNSEVTSPMFETTGMTQYPAVVLCDLQCQPVLNKKLGLLSPVPLVNTILTLLHYLTIATTFSPSTRSQVTSLFQTLEQALSTTSAQLETIVLNNFSLIHILISMPSTSTQPAIFRIKLLSRLLACNPSLAPHLMTAADRALQQKLAEADWTASEASRWTVSSLLTIKWSIQWLSKEHSKIRMQYRSGRVNQEYLYQKGKLGVDVGAVEAKYRLFDTLDPELTLDIVSSPASLEIPVNPIEAH